MKKKKILTMLIASALIASCGVGLTAAVSAMRADQKDQPETVLQETLDLNLQEITVGDSQQETAPMVEISGIAGDSAEWNFDPSTGTLSITGSGNLYPFGYLKAVEAAENGYYYSSDYTARAPWWDYRKQILKLEISDGIPGIPSDAFFACENLSSVTIPDSVEWIGESAFAQCSALETVSLGKNLRRIENAAFRGCGLTSITIPASVAEIGHQVFSDCLALKKVTFEGKLNGGGDLAFENCPLLESPDIPYSISGHYYNYYDYNRNTANVARRYEPMNDSELITDLCYGEYQAEDGTEYAYHVPQLNFDTADAERVNREIMEQYNQISGSGDWMLRWSVVRCDDIVGLIVERYDTQDNTVAETYNFDPQGNEISDADLLAMNIMYLDESYLKEDYAKELAKDFVSTMWQMTPDIQLSLYIAAEEASYNSASEAKFFMDPDYGLMMISKIASPIGADSSEETFPCRIYDSMEGMRAPGAFHAAAKALGLSLKEARENYRDVNGLLLTRTEDGEWTPRIDGDGHAWVFREDEKTDSGLIIRLVGLHHGDGEGSLEEQAAVVYDAYLAGECLTDSSGQIKGLTVYNTENGAKRIQITANGVDMGTFELDNTIEPQFIQLDSEAIVANRPAELEITVLESYGSTVPLSEQLAEVHVGFTSNISGAR